MQAVTETESTLTGIPKKLRKQADINTGHGRKLPTVTRTRLAALDPAVAMTHCPDHAIAAQHEVGTTVASCFPKHAAEPSLAGSCPGAAVKEHDTSAVMIVLDAAALQQ